MSTWFSTMASLRKVYELLRALEAIPEDLEVEQTQKTLFSLNKFMTEEADMLRAVCAGLLVQDLLHVLEEGLYRQQFLEPTSAVAMSEQVCVCDAGP